EIRVLKNGTLGKEWPFFLCADLPTSERMGLGMPIGGIGAVACVRNQGFKKQYSWERVGVFLCADLPASL
ncbi:MAG: hypothetical protein RBT70_07895, partial [Alphaproteobacteria bacterium]|nr:hypothetical protein [Alphaproteobacteria bacterium]